MTTILNLAVLQVALDWWAALSLTKSLFYGIGMVATLIALLLAVLAVIGTELHDAVDVPVGHEDAGGGGIFSIKPLTGFFLGFGWVGGLSLDAGFPAWAALGAALVAGAAFMAAVVLMFRAILSMRSDGTARIADTVGAVGTVYVGLPAGRAAGGQVTVSFNGRQETYSALAKGDAAIPSGVKVRVTEVVDNQTVRVEAI